MPQSSKLPVLNLHTDQKSAFLPPPLQGQLVAPIHVKFGTAKGHIGPLAVHDFTLIGAQRWESAPKWQKFPHFGKQLLYGGEPFDLFLQLLGAFICPTILHQCFTFDAIRFTFTELLLRNHASIIYPKFFRAPSRNNYALNRKMIGTFFNGLEILRGCSCAPITYIAVFLCGVRWHHSRCQILNHILWSFFLSI